jgi:3-oxoadipate enol-lactonase
MSLLFLHPVGLDRHAVEWLDLPGAVAATLPGHGERARARPGLTLDDMADEVAGWTDGPLDVVGASLGGMVALHLALAHPDRVRSMLLACTTARGDAETMRRRALDTEERGSAGMVESTLRRWFTPELLAVRPEPEPLAYARRRLLDTPAGVLADTWRAIGGHDVLDRLGEITAPVTCLAGTRDESTPLPVMRALAVGLARSRLVEAPVPHMAFLERPAEFTAAVREHLAWVAGGAEGTA